jgi:hypothetical protein
MTAAMPQFPEFYPYKNIHGRIEYFVKHDKYPPMPTDNKALSWLLQRCGVLDINGLEVCFFPEDNLSLYRYFAHHVRYDRYGFRRPK